MKTEEVGSRQEFKDGKCPDCKGDEAKHTALVKMDRSEVGKFVNTALKEIESWFAGVLSFHVNGFDKLGEQVSLAADDVIGAIILCGKDDSDKEVAGTQFVVEGCFMPADGSMPKDAISLTLLVKRSKQQFEEELMDEDERVIVARYAFDIDITKRAGRDMSADAASRTQRQKVEATRQNVDHAIRVFLRKDLIENAEWKEADADALLKSISDNVTLNAAGLTEEGGSTLIFDYEDALASIFDLSCYGDFKTVTTWGGLVDFIFNLCKEDNGSVLSDEEITNQ